MKYLPDEERWRKHLIKRERHVQMERVIEVQ